MKYTENDIKSFREVKRGFGAVVELNDGKKLYAGGYTDNGYVFKDYDAAESHSSEVCYIAEADMVDLVTLLEYKGYSFVEPDPEDVQAYTWEMIYSEVLVAFMLNRDLKSEEEVKRLFPMRNDNNPGEVMYEKLEDVAFDVFSACDWQCIGTEIDQNEWI